MVGDIKKSCEIKSVMYIYIHVHMYEKFEQETETSILSNVDKCFKINFMDQRLIFLIDQKITIFKHSIYIKNFQMLNPDFNFLKFSFWMQIILES